MKKNFKYLFEDKKIFGFYTDELSVALLAGIAVALPVYAFSSDSDLVIFRKLGGFFLLSIIAFVASVVLSTMRAVRGNDDKTFYVKLLGRDESPKTLKGKFAKFVLYLIVVDKVKGKERITKTRDYSP
ncbi:hypothetical protein Theam_1752 (plasmid) [Thermovibrio ammonificans HB-1]|uniref:Uncharacterized protein n=1 Tax=Thermovibrio ammonificans (strain DSM 15698 / JCM 12110 / HB-1) TaxID=648996 RepID=E8T6Y7_THEA1|nr:hypothetical protein [Thermovibrio ammonificans]ADU97708.1 hypothetical protein Theam_1752 [Thermovibrio ammonificans HB-1]